MKREIRKFKKDGFNYQTRGLSSDGGETVDKTVDLFCPITIEELTRGIAKRMTDSRTAAKDYVTGMVIRVRREHANAKKTGKVPQAEFDRIWLTLSPEDKQLPFLQVQEIIVERYWKEQKD